MVGMDPVALALWQHDRRIKPRRGGAGAVTGAVDAAPESSASVAVPAPVAPAVSEDTAA